jgi:hypothetical protein
MQNIALTLNISLTMLWRRIHGVLIWCVNHFFLFIFIVIRIYIKFFIILLLLLFYNTIYISLQKASIVGPGWVGRRVELLMLLYHSLPKKNP